MLRIGTAVVLGVAAWAVVVFLARRDVRLGVEALGAKLTRRRGLSRARTFRYDAKPPGRPSNKPDTGTAHGLPSVTVSPPDRAPPSLVIFAMGAFIQRENGTQARIAEQVGYFAGRLPRVAVYSYLEHPTHPWTPDAQARFRAAFPGGRPAPWSPAARR